MIYLGTLGSMVGLKCPASQQVEHADRITTETTLEGRVKAQVRPLGRRVWSASVSEGTTPADQAAIQGFLTGEWGPGPFVFVGADAPHTNLLTPRAASCLDLPGHVGITQGGPVNLGADGWAGSSLIADDPEAHTEIYAGTDMTPVLAGRSVTGSAWISAGAISPAYVRLYWRDAAGAVLGAVASQPVTAAQGMVRVAVTATPPAGAASVQLVGLRASRLARPALTWTTTMQSWAAGEGCAKAVIHAGSKDVTLAVPGLTYGSVNFTITEVG